MEWAIKHSNSDRMPLHEAFSFRMNMQSISDMFRLLCGTIAINNMLIADLALYLDRFKITVAKLKTANLNIHAVPIQDEHISILTGRLLHRVSRSQHAFVVHLL